MPVKRRHDKRRLDPAAHQSVWTGILECGYDYFHELAAIGVASDDYGRPDREAAAAAWAIFGPTIIEERHPDHGPAWGETEFGRPWEKDGAGDGST